MKTVKRKYYTTAEHEAKKREMIPIKNLYAITYDMPVIPARERVWIPQKQRY
jgi:hypothetical protein